MTNKERRTSIDDGISVFGFLFLVLAGSMILLDSLNDWGATTWLSIVCIGFGVVMVVDGLNGHMIMESLLPVFLSLQLWIRKKLRRKKAS